MIEKRLMKKKMQTFLTLTVVLLMSIAGVMTAGAATGDPVLLNEVFASHTGTDDTEFIEFYGVPGTSLDGLSLIIVESETYGQGTIDRQLDFGPVDVIGSNGFFLVGNPIGLAANYGVTPNIEIENNYLENSSLTVALVTTSSISGGLVTGDEVVLDTIALSDGGAGDIFYFSAPVIGPDGSYFPAGVRRATDGVDTDTVTDWVMSDFGLGSDNTPTGGDTPPPPPPPIVTIMEIQGDGQFSPFDGDVVETTGVVTLFTANGANFWLQDPNGDEDFVTSDGIFVSGGGYPDEGPRPEVGDFIRIIASVQEQQYGNALPLTRLRNVDLIEVLSSDNPLPSPVELGDLPDESIADGIAFWEPLEGMLVSVENGFVVAPTSGYGEFALVTELDAEEGSGYYPQTKQIIVRDLGGGEVDYNPERILVDDSTLDDPINVIPGDRVRSLVGAVDYTFGNYKLQPAEYEVKTHKLPKLPASTRTGPNGNLAITTFNVENLFDLELNIPVVVDVIGQVGFDPGSEWGSGDASTKDNTIRRKAGVCQGDIDGTDAFDPALEWDGFAKDTFDGLGAHSADCEPAEGLFISEYVEGSSYNKVIEIYNGTGSPVNLSASGYKLQIFFNGSTSAGQTISLSGTLADGDVYVVANSKASDEIKAIADQTTSGLAFNGDDAVVLSAGGKDDASSTPDPDELETQLTKLALAIEVELELPEIIVVQEIENTAILQVLGDRVNAATGSNYMAVSFETSDGRGIEVGFLWDVDRVALLDAYQMAGSDVEAAFGPTSPSPGREPLVGVFDFEGKEITIIGNHFKSKGGDDPLFGMNWPPYRVTEVQRKMQAQVVRDFVDSLFDEYGDDALVMVTGDLNDFQFGEPGEGDNHPIAILEGIYGGVPLTNLINLEKDAERWTYVYDGNSQVLDHMLVSPALFDLLVGTDVLHFNAGFPSDLGSDPSTPLRASDHDALEGRFKIK